MAPRFRALAALAENVGIARSPHMAAKDGFKGWGLGRLTFTVYPGRIDIHVLNKAPAWNCQSQGQSFL